jgi:hypothetical protein
MARAIAHCTCNVCGTTFERIGYRHSRDEADSWQKYVEENFTLCTDCWKKQKEEERKALGLVCDIYVNIDLTRQKGMVMCTLVADGDTYPHKDELKNLGYRWGSANPASGALGDWLGAKESRMAWSKSSPIEKVQELYAEFESIGGKGRNLFTDTDVALAKSLLDMQEKKKISTQTDSTL